MDADLAVKVNDLMLPVVKGVGSEQAYAKLTESLQTFGGSGFLQDYPIEQYIRDAKIDSLYEGTTAIQAQDFFFRKIVRDKGEALAYVSGQIQEFVDAKTGNGRLKTERALLATALADVQAMAATLTGYLMAAQEDETSLYKVGLGSVRFLMSVGDLIIGWLLQRQAAVAVEALDAGATGAERSFYEGKVAVASFFAKNFLPHLTSHPRGDRDTGQRHHGARRSRLLAVDDDAAAEQPSRSRLISHSEPESYVPECGPFCVPHEKDRRWIPSIQRRPISYAGLNPLTGVRFAEARIAITVGVRPQLGATQS